MLYKTELERIRKELEERKHDLTKELEDLPDGLLLCTEERTVKKYYQRLPATGNRKKERRYGVKTRPEVLDGLVRKKYVTEALKSLDSDLIIIDNACKSFVPTDEISIMSPFVEKYPDLSRSIYRIPIDEEEWKNAFDRIDNYHPENLTQTAFK